MGWIPTKGHYKSGKISRMANLNDFLIQGITLKLKPGSKVALVGPSGGGKVIYR